MSHRGDATGRGGGKAVGGRGKGRDGDKGASPAPDARGPESSAPGVQPAAARRGGTDRGSGKGKGNVA